jgi:hypothetical protein
MTSYLCSKISVIFVLAILLGMVFIIPVLAQEKLQKSPGGYHGELDFPISWKRYYSHAEWTKIMHDLQEKYPHLTDIETIGKSRMGRSQYVLTITAKSTGLPEKYRILLYPTRCGG